MGRVQSQAQSVWLSLARQRCKGRSANRRAPPTSGSRDAGKAAQVNLSPDRAADPDVLVAACAIGHAGGGAVAASVLHTAHDGLGCVSWDAMSFFLGLTVDGVVALWDADGEPRERSGLRVDPEDPVAAIAELDVWGAYFTHRAPWRGRALS